MWAYFFWTKDDLPPHLPELGNFIHDWHSGKCVPLLVCGWPGRSCWTRAKQLLPRGNKTAKQNLNQPPSQTDLLSSLSCICVCSMNIVHPQFKFVPTFTSHLIKKIYCTLTCGDISQCVVIHSRLLQFCSTENSTK